MAGLGVGHRAAVLGLGGGPQYFKSSIPPAKERERRHPPAQLSAGVHNRGALITRPSFLPAPAPAPVTHQVIHERGSPETLRDPRGFAVKLYTREGNFDLVRLRRAQPGGRSVGSRAARSLPSWLSLSLPQPPSLRVVTKQLLPALLYACLTNSLP